MKTLTQLALTRKVAAHKRWLESPERGRRFSLKDLDLAGADMTEADLRNAKFIRCRLTAAKFIRANLQSAEFVESEIDYVNFRAANLTNLYLRDCKGHGTHFEGANLQQATFGNSVFTVPYFDAFTQFDGIDLEQASINMASTQGSSLILLGQDPRGYSIYAYADKDNVLNICSGCRHFVGIEAAYAHWSQRTYAIPAIREHYLGILNALNVIALARGILTEPLPKKEN